MILNNEVDTLESNILNAKNFTVAADGFIFQMLSDKIYTDKIAAVIREIACNAYDAHIASGQNKSFIVTLPSLLNPVFSVEDFGLGLSEEDIENLYCRIGGSNKRSSNSEVGGFGIGASSPFAYTDSFTVVSTYNGIRSTYLLFKSNGIPSYTKISSDATTEGNGVKVCVDVQNSHLNDFKMKAMRQLSFFPTGTIEVRGDFKTIPYRKVKDILHFNLIDIQSAGMRQWYAKQGPVLYTLPMDRDIVGDNFYSIFRQKHFALEFEIGDLAVTPSRETLSLDAQTKKNILDKCNKIVDTYFADTWINEFEGKPVDYALTVKAMQETNDMHIAFGINKEYDAIKKIAETTFQHKGNISGVTIEGRFGNSTRKSTNFSWSEFFINTSTNVSRICIVKIDEDKRVNARVGEYLKNSPKYTRAIFAPSGMTGDDFNAIFGNAFDVLKVSSMPLPAVKTRSKGLSKTAKQVKIWNGHLFCDKILTDEEADDEFYILWINKDSILSNDSLEHNKDSLAMPYSKAQYLQVSQYEGKPVYYLTAINKSLAKDAENLYAVYKEKAKNVEWTDYLKQYSHPAHIKVGLNFDFNKKDMACYVAFQDAAAASANALAAKNNLRHAVMQVYYSNPVDFLEAYEHNHYTLQALDIKASDLLESAKKTVYTAYRQMLKENQEKEIELLKAA